MFGGRGDDPFRDFDNIVRNLFNMDGAIAQGSPFGGRTSFLSSSSRGSWMPAMSLLETPSSFQLSADLPGLKREDMEVQFKDGRICVKGSRMLDLASLGLDQNTARDASMHLSERGFGAFERCFGLPSKVREDTVRAEYADGVLNVTMDKDAQGITKGPTINIR